MLLRGGVAALVLILYFWAFYPTAISWLGPTPLTSYELLEDVGPTDTIDAWEPIDLPVRRFKKAVEGLNFERKLCKGVRHV